MTPTAPPVTKRKLIEVSLPLEAINVASARENYIYKGNPSSVHKWWAQRPLATARAIIFAQLVDDPSSHPVQFPTPEAQAAERERLHGIIRRLVIWENINDGALLEQAHTEILKSTGGSPPPIFDPFAGGGTIPLEAQRLGLDAHASDLNPVAVLINKALIEVPPKFAGRPPVFPGAGETKLGAWPRSSGLAEDIRRYGAWMRERAEERIGHLYPTAALPDGGGEANVIAWIWARTVTCPNPACGIQMPLVRSWWLGKKKGKEAYIVPTIIGDVDEASGRKVVFSIGHGRSGAPRAADVGTVAKSGATCVACGSSTDLKYIRSEGRAGRLGQRLLAIVAEAHRLRHYLAATPQHESAAMMPGAEALPEGALPEAALGLRVQAYGMTSWTDLFTSRQLRALISFSDLVAEAREQVYSAALEAGFPAGIRLEAGGDGAAAYADAVATFLAFAVDKTADYGCSLAVWYQKEDRPKNLFARQSIPMVWDYPEVSPFSRIGGGFEACIRVVSEGLGSSGWGKSGSVRQIDAQSALVPGSLISTDPPYYDNIGYADLSDFFYVWLRRSLLEVFPSLLSTMLVPKADELVANPHRHGGVDGASDFFERGFLDVFAHARGGALEDYPIAVYYAFKQAELETEGVASTGWATLLEGMIRSGWTITGTWPVRSERSGRMRDVGSNALASSIVLALRPRHVTAEATSRRGFLAALKAELPNALRELQQGAIAPVDLAQATIGPGMAVFSRYSKVVEADGSSMTVKTALALINQALDEVLAEQDGDLDPDSRFCLKWYTQYGWSEQSFGEADVLARATNTSVDGLARGGALTSKAGRVKLLAPADLDAAWDPLGDDRISLWEATLHLARSLDSDGGETTARLMAGVGQRVELDAVQLLAYRLYELTQATRPQDALLFNGLGTSWSDLTTSAHRVDVTPRATQSGFDFDALAGE